MKILTLACSCFVLTALALVVSAVQRPPAINLSDLPTGGITTLYANDPIECTLDLRTGQSGLMMQGGEVRNRDSHIFLGYFPDSLTVGAQGADTGAIVDLGTLQEVSKANSIQMVGNGGNVYLTLKLPWVSAHPGLQQASAIAHAPIKAGHVYLGRIVDEGNPDLFAKLIVLDFRPGESVTFRWQRIEE